MQKCVTLIHSLAFSTHIYVHFHYSMSNHLTVCLWLMSRVEKQRVVYVLFVTSGQQPQMLKGQTHFICYKFFTVEVPLLVVSGKLLIWSSSGTKCVFICSHLRQLRYGLKWPRNGKIKQIFESTNRKTGEELKPQTTQIQLEAAEVQRAEHTQTLL